MPMKNLEVFMDKNVSVNFAWPVLREYKVNGSQLSIMLQNSAGSEYVKPKMAFRLYDDQAPGFRGWVEKIKKVNGGTILKMQVERGTQS